MKTKTKFDDNVAQAIPETRASAEPELPWKLPDSEMSRIEASDGSRTVSVTEPPLRVRAVFVILLVVAIFVFVMNGIMNVAIDNSEMQLDMLRKEQSLSDIKAALVKADDEKAALSEDAARLEQRVIDLNEQKDIYTAVIETLTKKPDDTQII